MSSSDLDGLAKDLAADADDVMGRVRATVKRGAQQVKTDWRERVSGFTHLKHLERAIGYDIETRGGTVQAVIGVREDSPQSSLAHLREFGSANNGPGDDGGQALAAEEPRFLQSLREQGLLS
jgi:hypothetical protein